MKSKTIIALVLSFFLVSCASTVQTSTNTPVVQTTFTASPTETPEPIPTSTFTPEPTFDWSNVPMNVTYALTDKDEQKLGLDPTGQGMAVRVNVEGVEKNYTVSFSDLLMERIGGILPDFNPLHVGTEDDPMDRVGKLILQGDWLGWMEDNGEITFEEYTRRVASGEEMSYGVKAISTETNTQVEATFDPSMTTEIVYQMLGETDNGNRWMTSPNGGYSWYVDPEENIRRVIIFLPENEKKADYLVYLLNAKIATPFYSLAMAESDQGIGESPRDKINTQREDIPDLDSATFYRLPGDPSYVRERHVVFVPGK